MGSLELPLRKYFMALLFPLVLTISLLTLVDEPSRTASAAEPVRARAVQGVLHGGQFAQIWLGLVPEFADAQITVLAEWDRLFPAAHGLNFFIFDEQQLRRLDDGRASFSAIALAAGSPRFALSTPDNAIGAGFNATGWASYAIVLINESAEDATFTLRVGNAFLIDTSTQVTTVGEPVPVAPPLLTQPVPLAASTSFTTWTPLTSTTWSSTTAANETPTPVAPTSVTTTVTTTVPVTSTATITLLMPVARTGLGQNKRLTRVSGSLALPTAQQIVRIKPTKVNGQIILRLVADEGAEGATAGATALNFWVFDEAGFSQYLTGTEPGTVAVSAGKRLFRSQTAERVAGFRSESIQPYTIVIYSNETQPVTYTFGVEGAQVLENFYLP